jgi:hypothetical protein
VEEAGSLAVCVSVFSDVGIGDEAPILVWTGRGNDGIPDGVLPDELLDQAIEHIPELK